MTERAVSHILYSLAFAFFVTLFTMPIERDFYAALQWGATAGLFMLVVFLVAGVWSSIFQWLDDMGYIGGQDDEIEEETEKQKDQNHTMLFEVQIEGRTVRIDNCPFDRQQMRVLFYDLLEGKGAYAETKKRRSVRQYDRWELAEVLTQLEKRGLITRAGNYSNSPWVLTSAGEKVAKAALGTSPLPQKEAWILQA